MERLTCSSCPTKNIAFITFTVLLMAISHVTCNLEVRCEPRRRVVHLSDGSKHMTPNSIELYECSGPFEEKQRCAAIDFQEVKVEVFVEGTVEPLVFRNHTKCQMRCSCNKKRARSSHICNDTDKYDIACPHRQRWNFTLCKCAPIDADKAEGPETGCGKKSIEQGDDSIPLTIFILALAVELVVVLVVVFLVRDLCKYNRRESGVIHKTAELIRSVSSRPLERNMSMRKNRSDTGSESFLNTYNASTGKIDTV